MAKKNKTVKRKVVRRKDESAESYMNRLKKAGLTLGNKWK